jgi:hypothetical protein
VLAGLDALQCGAEAGDEIGAVHFAEASGSRTSPVKAGAAKLGGGRRIVKPLRDRIFLGILTLYHVNDIY